MKGNDSNMPFHFIFHYFMHPPRARRATWLKGTLSGRVFFQFPKICPTWLNTGPTWPHRAQPTSEKHLQISAVWAVPTREVGWMFISLESHNPSFFWSNGLDHFVWSLRLWSSGTTCVRVATAFHGLFSTKCRKNTVLLRVGLCESCYGFFSAFFQQNFEKIRFCYR